MAYSATSMRRIDGVPGQQLFAYVTADMNSVVEASAYFDDAVADYNLSTGDIIAIVHDTGGTILGDFYVATNTSGTVTVTQRS